MSLGVLVERFGAFVAESAPAATPWSYPEEPFPNDLVRVREAIGHHLIPLLLLASIDGECIMAERQIILRYCLDRARAAGLGLSFDEKAALSDYVNEFRPSLSQLGAAVKKLHHDSKPSLTELIVAAQAVVDADGVRRAREVKFLEDLSRDLAGL
jgi:hypothetical protein